VMWADEIDQPEYARLLERIAAAATPEVTAP
jgi:hypothetical protein